MLTADPEAKRERAISMVISILRSPLFLSHSTQEQEATLDEIVATGEVSRRDVHNLIVQEQHRQTLVQRAKQNTVIPSQPIRNSNLQRPNQDYNYLANLPFDVFIKIIDSGQIKGVDLIRLCNSSPKLREMCLRDRQFVNNEGQVYKSESQYVYRKLLAEAGITDIPSNFNPAELYRAFATSYYLSAFDLSMFRGNDLEKIPIKANNLFCKQVATGKGYSLILDITGRVWIALWEDFYGNEVGEVTMIPDLENIVQVATGAGDNRCGFIDSNGDVLTIRVTDLLSEDHPQFYKFNFDLAGGDRIKAKIKKLEIENGTYLLDTDSNLFLYKRYIWGGSVTLLASNIKDFKFSHIVVPGGLAVLANEYYNGNKPDKYNLAAITHSNEILVFNDRGESFTFSIQGVVPKKVVPSGNRILILSEDGHAYVFDKSLSDYSGNAIIRRVAENVAQVQAENIVDIDTDNTVGFAINSNGNLFTFNIRNPGERGADPNLPYLVLEQVPQIGDAKKISVAYHHVDVLRDQFG